MPDSYTPLELSLALTTFAFRFLYELGFREENDIYTYVRDRQLTRVEVLHAMHGARDD